MEVIRSCDYTNIFIVDKNKCKVIEGMLSVLNILDKTEEFDL